MDDLIFDDQDVVSKSTSDGRPTHYTVQINLFSLLTTNNIERYETSDFEAGGYRWKLAIYPNGNKNKGIKDHLSLYLVKAETAELSLRNPGWEVHAVFRLFLLDQNKDNYLILQGKGKRFHGMKHEWGFDKFISLNAFNDPSNGYLVDDNCFFGAEVFVCKEQIAGVGECLSMVKDAITYKHTWKVFNFTKLNLKCYESEAFNAGDHKWKIQLYPKGKDSGMGTHLSLYVALAEPGALSPSSKLFAEVTLRLLDQSYGSHHFGKASLWFSSARPERGWNRFISQGYFTQAGSGYLMRDSCLFEAEVTIHGVANPLYFKNYEEMALCPL